MRIRVEYARDLDVPTWESRHAAGEVPDRWPYGLDRLAAHGHRLSPAPSLSGVRTTRLARALSHRLGGVEWLESARRSSVGETDLVLCQDERAGLPALLRERLLRRDRPVVTGAVWLASEAGVSRAQRWLARRLLPGAAAVWTYSRAEVGPLCALYGVSPDRVHAVDFGIDAEFFTPGEPEVVHDVALVVSAGNDRHRDFDLLLDSLRALRAGGAPLRAQVASTVWTAPAADRSWFVAEGTDGPGVRRLYRQADVVVVPTRSNLHVSGVTVALEAMCCGLPVVVSATPGFERYVDHGRTGLLVPPGNRAALAAAVGQVLADPAAARRMGARARAEVLSRFTSTHLVQQLDHVLQGLVRQGLVRHDLR